MTKAEFFQAVLEAGGTLKDAIEFEAEFRCINDVNDLDDYYSRYSSAPDVVTSAFTWAHTKGGHDRWVKLHQKLCVAEDKR